MLAPILWLVASSLQTDGQLSTRHATTCSTRRSRRSADMWKTVDFERYLINSLIICTVAALLATAFAAPPATRSRASGSAARRPVAWASSARS